MALGDGLPEVAAQKAGRLLAAPGGLSAEEKEQVGRLAVEAWVRARNGRAALEVMEKTTFPGQAFWKARALMLTGDLVAAEQLLLADMTDAGSPALHRLLLAQISLALGNTTQARELLSPLSREADARTSTIARLMLDELAVNSGTYLAAIDDLATPALQRQPSAALLRARALAEVGRYEEARAQLQALLSNTGGGERVHDAASVLLAEVLQRQGETAAAMEALVQFLDHTLESAEWASAFDLLARILREGNGSLSLPDACLRWVAEGNTEQRKALQTPASTSTFQGHAMLLLARWLIQHERVMEALGLLEAMIQVHPGHPQASEAMRLALETYGALKVDARVTALADQWRRRFGTSGSSLVDFVTAGTAYERKEYAQAASLFQAAANVATSLAERRAALYNAGVAALRAGEFGLYQALLGQLQVVSADGALKTGDGAADLELDRALDLAARTRPEAEQELTSFARRHPGHPRLADARTVLAETLLLKTPPDFAGAERALQQAAATPNLTSAQQQRISLTRLWLADRRGDLKTVTEAGAEFVKNWPEAAAVPEVRMKVAEAHYRQENLASARTEFELVARDYPRSPYAETALYFAGMSAVSLIGDGNREAAIDLWQEVAQRGGPLSIPARQQQALAKRLLGKDDEALKLLDALLLEEKLADETRRSLICEKAEILMLERDGPPARLQSAADVLRGLLKEPELPYVWRARAGYTLACALDALGDKPGALEACYDVVQAQGSTGPSNPSEFHWYYRAGFFGIGLLEASKQWESAARLAEKLAQSAGEGAAEAKERATTIRLNHFLWDGDVK